MEVKINKEIRQYKENIFFGLTLRQFICSVLACATAVAIYFVFKPILNNTGTVSWLCIAGAVPFALLGFAKYNGMAVEKFVVAWLKSEILIPKRLVFKPDNLYLEMYKQSEKNIKKSKRKTKKREKRVKKKDKKNKE